jgi:hypothetical protein
MSTCPPPPGCLHVPRLLLLSRSHIAVVCRLYQLAPPLLAAYTCHGLLLLLRSHIAVVCWLCRLAPPRWLPTHTAVCCCCCSHTSLSFAGCVDLPPHRLPTHTAFGCCCCGPILLLLAGYADSPPLLHLPPRPTPISHACAYHPNNRCAKHAWLTNHQHHAHHPNKTAEGARSSLAHALPHPHRQGRRGVATDCNCLQLRTTQPPPRQAETHSRENGRCTRGDKSRLFRPGADLRGGVCATCLSRHKHPFGKCKACRLWNGAAAGASIRKI